ncbi:MFS transporter [Stygiolobus caldivivus]|uniref:MFS transporter n=1 Tax=Stygiolobus caldivivus TaxID=2824673 RepID=A0A8D5ZI72_9CREN|nr:MFS transporter [Stygiolobus caldivivus]BCU69032.1 MFS transporter [Stygiolobus caldivivus]
MRQNLVLTVIVLGTLMAAVDTTIVLLALPTITLYFKTDLYTSIWVLLSYLLVQAVISTQAGRIGDIIGRSRIYNIGFALFTVASALCGLSNNVYLLIAFRVIQALGGSLISANGTALIADLFPPSNRGRAYGLTALGWNIGALVGIVLGGILTTLLGWQYIFFINVPIGIFAVAVGLREIRDINPTKSKLDITGSIILGLILMLVSYGLIDIAGEGLDLSNILYVAVGLGLLPLFVLNEMKVERPIVNLKLLKIRLLSYSLYALLFQGIGGLSLTFLLIMYLQGVKGLSPLYASLILIPGYVVASILSPIVGKRTEKTKPGLLASIGLTGTLISLILYFIFLTPYSSPYLVSAISIITGIGSSLFWPSNNTAIMFSAPREYYGAVSGLARTFSSIGTVLSYVISITVASVSVPRYVAFEIFLGTDALDSKTMVVFTQGLHYAFLVSSVFILVSMLLSILTAVVKIKS